jgi:Ras-related protein Rab-1A
LLLLGESGVGKSSLLIRYSDNEFSNNMMGTTGIDFRHKIINIKNSEINNNENL